MRVKNQGASSERNAAVGNQVFQLELEAVYDKRAQNWETREIGREKSRRRAAAG